DYNISRSERESAYARPGDGYLELNVYHDFKREKYKDAWDMESTEAWLFQERWRARTSRSRTIREALLLIKEFINSLGEVVMDARFDQNKQHIIDNQHKETIQSYVNNPLVQDMLYSPLMNLIAREYELDAYTKIKLLALDDVLVQEIK